MGIKDQFPDAILFFRMGDFYEMFFDDARIASRILGITLTSRGTYNGDKVPMCGIPHHANRAYIGKLLDSGWKVAICEQIGDPGSTKGIVEREVVRLVTPGSVVDEKELDDKSHLFMAAVSGDEGAYGLAHVDLSTGEFRVTEMGSFDAVVDELARIDPAEVLIPEDDHLTNRKPLSSYRLEVLKKDSYDPREAVSLLKQQLQVRSLTGFGCQNMPQAIIAAGAIVSYLRDTQKGFPEHIREIVTYHLGDYMVLDESTYAHLELLKTMRRQSVKGSLFDILDKTVTPMGSRLLKNWISYPLINLDKIRERSAGVACLKEDALLRRDIRDELKKIYDIARLNGRIALKRANARDLIALKSSLLRLPFIKDALKDSNSALLSDIGAHLDTLQDIAQLIDASVQEEPPVSLKEGGIIKEGYNDELDRLIFLSRDGKSWIARFARSEQERTGISSLKVGFNKVFGYYIEVTKANLHLVPDDYIRKQTLTHGERYITEALKVKEEEVLGAEEKRIELEGDIFEGIRKKIATENQRLRETAALVSQIDVIAGLAETAEANEYTCPEVNDSAALDILQGRHPVIELSVKEEDFVPNDIHLDS
ncbi:MAG: mismatch repair protein MutS, partial [Thermodesulfobacteriota bacterium]|nr:mismatch repair protein MutS [Thermodesulfobacteriota bacterium]